MCVCIIYLVYTIYLEFNSSHILVCTGSIPLFGKNNQHIFTQHRNYQLTLHDRNINMYLDVLKLLIFLIK